MTDALVAPVWLAATVLLIYSAWSVARRLFGEESILLQLRHMIILSWTTIVVATISLGLCQLLTPAALLLAVTAISAGALCIVRFAGQATSPQHGTAQPLPSWSATDSGERAWHWIWPILFVIGVAEVVFNGLLTFPSGWDSLNYHIPIIDQWLRVQSMYAPDQATWFVPGNNELLGLWLVAPYSGDFLVSLINIPSTVLLAVSTIELGRALGLSVFFRHTCTLAIIGSVPVMRQLLDPKNDMAVCALFMATLCYGLSWIRCNRGSDLAFAGVSLGLLVGVKYYAVGYGCLACGGMALAAWKLRGRRDAIRLAVGMGLIALFVGGYWYGRNAWFTGTPFYPKGFTQNTDLVGEMRSQASNVWQTTLLGNDSPAVFYLLLKALWNMGGPCQWLAFLFLPCTFTWLLGSGFWLIRNDNDSRGLLRVMLALGILATGLIWGFTPFGAESAPGTLDMLRGGYLPSRFGFCFLSLSLLGLTILLQDGFAAFTQRQASKDSDDMARRRVRLWQRGLSYVLLTALVGAVLWQLFFFLIRETKQKFLVESLLLAANLVLGAVLINVVWQTWPAFRPAVGALGALISMGIAYSAVAWLAPRWHEGFPAFYDELYKDRVFVLQAKMDPEITRFCVLDYRIYPFMGSQRQFRVSQPMWLPSYPRFLEYLQDHDATVAVVKASDSQGVRRYDGKLEWLQEHPETFQLIYHDSSYFFFRVNRRSLQKALSTR